MPLTEMTKLPDDAAVWVFGISPAVGDPDALLRRVDAFLLDWTTHGTPVPAARELRDGSFLVVAARKDAETSGCSIDKLFGLVRALEQEFGVSMLDPSRVFYRRADGEITSSSRAEFKEVATPHTPVFDTAATTLGALRAAWERPASESWHASLLRKSA